MTSGSQRSQYLAGLRTGVPVILSFIPVGIAYGVMARQAGFSAFETVFMSLTVFAGASQMMALGMYVQGAAVTVMILTTFILNLRHLIMSTCVINRIKDVPLRLRLLAAFGVTDESFAIFTTEKKENCTVPYFLGLITATYSSWVAGSAIGALASGLLPAIVASSMGIALYAMFIGLLFPNLTQNRRLGALVLLTAVCNLILTRFMDSSWALIVSTLICAMVGVPFVDLDEQEEKPDES